MPGIARTNIRTLLIVVAAALASLAIVGCGTRDASADVPTDPFPALMGTWAVDMDATMEQARENPEIDPAELERMPAMIEKMMGTMSLQMTSDAMVTQFGARKQRMSYSVKSTAPGKVVVSMKARGQSATCTFDLLPGNRMRFSSSASDDMDNYVWKRMPAE